MGKFMSFHIVTCSLLYSSTFSSSVAVTSTSDSETDSDSAIPATTSTAIPATTTTSTTTLPHFPDDLLPEQRGSITHWYQGLPQVHFKDGMRLKEACSLCNSEKIREMLQTKEKAEATDTRFWNFTVNRQFGAVDERQNTCIHEVAFTWVHFDRDIISRDPTIATVGPRVGTRERCAASIDLLITIPGFDIDAQSDAGNNAMDIAYRQDSILLAEHLVKDGDKKAPREWGTPDACINACNDWLTPQPDMIAEISRFEVEKRNSTNAVAYDRAQHHLNYLLNKEKWCTFFSKNELECPYNEVHNVLPNWNTLGNYPKQMRWAAAKMRELFKIPPATDDANLLGDKDYKPWLVGDHSKLAGQGVDSTTTVSMSPKISGPTQTGTTATATAPEDGL